MRLKALLLPLVLGLAACSGTAMGAETFFNAPPARVQSHAKGLQTAIFSGGCFWGVEDVFSHTRGVRSAITGYRGGTIPNPTYDQVSTGTTGYAESVKVVYDPSVVRYDQLLRIFFSVIANPTLHDRQGPDVGTQYRAALVPLNAEQRQVAQAYLKQMASSGVWKKPIVVRIEKASRFYPAANYHQDFAYKHPDNPYIRYWDAPKVEALKARFPQLYRASFRTG